MEQSKLLEPGSLVEWRLSNRAHCGAKHRNG